MSTQLKLLFLGAGAMFFLGLGAASSGKPVRVAITLPDGGFTIEVNTHQDKKNIPFFKLGETHLIASLPTGKFD